MTQLYEAALQKTTTAAAGIIAVISASSSARPDLRELWITLASAPASGPSIGFGRPASAGATPSGAVLGQATDHADPASTCSLVPSFTTAPTAPTIPMRRISLPNAIGAGIGWTWDRQDLNMPTSGQLIIWQYTALAVTYDIWAKWEE